MFEIEIHDLLFEKLIVFSHKKSAPQSVGCLVQLLGCRSESQAVFYNNFVYYDFCLLV